MKQVVFVYILLATQAFGQVNHGIQISSSNAFMIPNIQLINNISLGYFIETNRIEFEAGPLLSNRYYWDNGSIEETKGKTRAFGGGFNLYWNFVNKDHITFGLFSSSNLYFRTYTFIESVGVASGNSGEITLSIRDNFMGAKPIYQTVIGLQFSYEIIKNLSLKTFVGGTFDNYHPYWNENKDINLYGNVGIALSYRFLNFSKKE